MDLVQFLSDWLTYAVDNIKGAEFLNMLLEQTNTNRLGKNLI